jgi:hypothetical protein
MPPVDSTTGSVCCPQSFSALGDQRAEILPVQRPPALAVGGRCMMLLTRILMFPFFSLSIMDQLPLHRVAFQNAQRTSLDFRQIDRNLPLEINSYSIDRDSPEYLTALGTQSRDARLAHGRRDYSPRNRDFGYQQRTGIPLTEYVRFVERPPEGHSWAKRVILGNVASVGA